MDRREEILNEQHGIEVAKDGMQSISTKHFPLAYRDAALNSMDVYMKETVLEAFEYVVKNTTGHSIDEDGSVHFKAKEQWLSTEELFQNFL